MSLAPPAPVALTWFQLRRTPVDVPPQHHAAVSERVLARLRAHLVGVRQLIAHRSRLRAALELLDVAAAVVDEAFHPVGVAAGGIGAAIPQPERRPREPREPVVAVRVAVAAARRSHHRGGMLAMVLGRGDVARGGVVILRAKAVRARHVPDLGQTPLDVVLVG